MQARVEAIKAVVCSRLQLEPGAHFRVLARQVEFVDHGAVVEAGAADDECTVVSFFDPGDCFGDESLEAPHRELFARVADVE